MKKSVYFLIKKVEDIVFYTKRWDRYKKFPAGYIVPTGKRMRYSK